MAEVAILIPLMRPHRLADVLASLEDSTTGYTVVVIATGECADVARESRCVLIEDEGGTYPVRINKGFAATTEPYVFLGADDIRFRTGWFDAAMSEMNHVHGVVAINDLHNGAGVHFLVDRTYVDELGGTGDGEPGVVLHEGYQHTYCDDELRHVAQFRDRFRFAGDAIVEHLHPGAGKAPTDETYAIGNATMGQGSAVFHARRHLWGQ